MNESSANKLRILVADDEQYCLDLFDEILSVNTENQQKQNEMEELEDALFSTEEQGMELSNVIEHPIFQNGRYELVTCTQGEDAVEIVRQSIEDNNPFAITFLDVRMPPGMDGIMAAEQIRELDPNIEIIIVTGYSDLCPDHFIDRIPPAHKLLYIQKPFHLYEIQQFIHAISSKWEIEQKYLGLQEKLEKEVDDRTVALQEDNRQLQQDITKRKKVENQLLVAVEEAKKLDLAKSEFLANMSHEIRTPINGIIGMTEILKDTNTDDSQNRYLQIINTEANSLLQIINDVLDFSKIEAGKLELEQIPFDLLELFDDLSGTFSFRAEKNGLEFISFLSPKIPNLLFGDPCRLRQIFVNLVGNSLKFTEKGEITVRADLHEETEEEAIIRFQVKDTGIGIPAEKQSQIFESFTQVDGSTTRKFGGTGLGTTISKQFVTLMGGDITLESEPKKGTTFVFHIPFAKQKITPSAPSKFSGLRVLLMESKPEFQQIIFEYLDYWGAETTAANDMMEAMNFLDQENQEPFELLIINFKELNINPSILLNVIRSIEQSKQMPIISISTGTEEEQKALRELGIYNFLTKPVKQQEFYQLILSALHPPERKETKSSVVDREEEATADSTIMVKEARILLAEDYPTNQQMAMYQLKKAGFHVDLAENGLQAVNMFRQEPYDLILMDIQMPEMDGFQATELIRKAEEKDRNSSQKKEKKRIPIVAMTAHAIKGYREKCIEAGMDDYLTKPLKKDELIACIRHWITTTGDNSEGSDPAEEFSMAKMPIVRDTMPLDYCAALKECYGDKEFLFNLLSSLERDARRQIQVMRRALSDNNPEVIHKEAHSIKGAAANLKAQKIYDLALQLEELGDSGELEQVPTLLDNLNKKISSLKNFIEDNQ